MHKDPREYFKFTARSRLEKSINSLLGLIEGITIDGSINNREVGFLNSWLDEHREVQDRHPFNELLPVVEQAISDGILTDEERQDVLWLCERLRSTDFYDVTTADIQRLHAVLGGIAADDVISEAELQGLSTWLSEHEHLRACWPYDEIDSVIMAVLSDKKINEQEQQILKAFFSEFVAILDDRTIRNPRLAEGASLVGVCAVCPEIIFAGASFCFTGTSFRCTRSQFSDVVKKLGGKVVSSVSSKLAYLIIGAGGNPCWAYACYGRKVEQAVELRKKGARLLIVHENDFHDAVADKAT